jgi:hypothetical protein
MISEARGGGWNLIFDADDTLWDSNLYFLEAQAAFFARLHEIGLADPARIHASLRAHEFSIINEIGYGRRPYVMALHRVIDELVEPTLHERVRPHVEQIGGCWHKRSSIRRAP